MSFYRVSSGIRYKEPDHIIEHIICITWRVTCMDHQFLSGTLPRPRSGTKHLPMYNCWIPSNKSVSGTVLLSTYLYQVQYCRQSICIKYHFKNHLHLAGFISYIFISYNTAICKRYHFIEHLPASGTVS